MENYATTPVSKKVKVSDDDISSSEKLEIASLKHSTMAQMAVETPIDSKSIGDENNETKTRTTKREDYLSWDDYFMAVAFLSAQRSKDPSTQVGACIVNKDKRIVGIGYNGFPRGCSDDVLPWARTPENGEGELGTKYPYVTHAEVNAILNKCSADVSGATIYVALFPCEYERFSNFIFFNLEHLIQKSFAVSYR